jgi:3-oxoacyl-[acyl-carrier-protein] synthase-3
LGTGVYLPKREVSAEEVDAKIGQPPGTVADKTGVTRRHYADQTEPASVMGAAAARVALDRAGLKLEDVDLIVGASGTVEQPLPCNASLLQRALGAPMSGITCFDVNSTCLSFVTALDVVSSMLATGRYRNALIVSSETASVGLDWTHVESAGLFGDGAAAAVVTGGTPSTTGRVVTARFETYSAGADHCCAKGGGTRLPFWKYTEELHREYCFAMDGPAVFRMALEILPGFVERAFAGTPYSLAECDLVIPHQASKSALAIMRRKLGVKRERWMEIVTDHGNMIAASIPCALNKAVEENRIHRGSIVTLLGTSAGFTAGALVLEY